MRAVVVYESMFGNTREVAEAIGEGIREADPRADVACLRIADADATRVETADLLVLGGPTHMRAMTRGMTRKMGLQVDEKAQQEGKPTHLQPGAEGPGAREWLQSLPKVSGVKAAAFDTRGDNRMAGGAAHGIARKLRGHGFDVVAAPEGFVIEDMQGPLREGERDRAKAWAAGLVRTPAR